MFTPQVEIDGVWQRVRVHDMTAPGRGSNRVYIDGTYPLVENGAEVTAETPRVRLSGFFDAAEAPCGLGCRCDAKITPQPGSVAERVAEKDVWVVGQEVVIVGQGVRSPRPGVSATPGRVTRVSAASVWIEAPGQVGTIRFTWKTPKWGVPRWSAGKWGPFGFAHVLPATPEWRPAIEEFRAAQAEKLGRRALRRDLDAVSDLLPSLTPEEVAALRTALAPVVERLQSLDAEAR